ncbi:MAG: bifunctional [glutamate--ammonia ligase]-adenylyl-L-tyrosine phosphorylase/[glutamate--ammonia-ligase] adenylyltransferase [Deltaproteobacteria bacterium]|jgi:glutamate-ammonia-ligase adenylyltransferase|nr:bifunctional [glutamate--ammonia ligase]-adenylyl-L-tyrosine phosphorylase/[glutamate--ammonia-ligase] adenylyltransferase [Deltaproteobacteria bacterium]
MKQNDELPKELLEDAQQKWDAFKSSAESSGIPLPRDPEIVSSLRRVFAFSDFVAESCIREPDLLHDLIHSGDLQRHYAPNDFIQPLIQNLEGVNQEDELNRVLRKYRRREMVRIAWRDLDGWADLAQTVTDLSAMADTCLEQAYRLLFQWQSEKLGTPTAADGSVQNLVILALGKLGARELNFSSDVDLIFAYPQSGKTQGTPKSLSNDDFFVRLCRQLIKVIGSPTADGFVFRVDLRLRPFGESGPMVMNFDAMESYYQEQGREWERYALIKARVVAGDKTDGEDLLKRLTPFIYRRYLDYSAFESLRDMKQMISMDVKRKGMQNNIKLGPGGIREIEFFGQIFQLIRGGVTPALQDRRIQEVLKTLARQNFISTDTCNELVNAYVFLRNTEHRLQEFSDQQTHSLPAGNLEKIKLAATMGLANPQAYAAELERHRNSVHAHFQMLLETDETEGRDKEIEGQLHGIWQNLVSGDQAIEILSSAGFDAPEAVLNSLDYLRNHLETRELSQTGRQRLDKLIPRILKETSLSDQPVSTLQRIIDLVKSIERRTSYLALLLENPTILAHLVKLSNASPWITSFLARHPVLLDELLDPRTLYTPPATADLKTDLQRRMAQIPSEDLEYQIEELCIYKQIHVLRVAAADVSGTLPLMRVSDHLSEIAETILNQVVALAWDHLVEKHGFPVCRCDDAPCEKGFAVIAYGKLGGLELGYGSDLDLVFLHTGTSDQTRGGERPIDSAQFFNRLGQRVIHLLTSHTRAGKAYELDMRLRPSGSSGILVSHIDGFEEYHLKDSWTWEHQALIKARPVCGEVYLTERFEKIRREVLGRPRNKSGLRKEVVDMRERMRTQLLTREEGIFDLKQDVAGMVDIEFLVQYLVLLKSHEYPELLRWTDNVRLLQTLIETGVVDENTAHILKHAYLIYRAAAHQLSLQEKPAKVSLEKFGPMRARVREICKVYLKST